MVINGRCTDKAKVHVESGARVIHLLGFSTGGTFMDPSLLFPINVTKRVKFEAVWETIHSSSERDELIFSAVSQTSGPEFRFQLVAKLVGRTDTREHSRGCC